MPETWIGTQISSQLVPREIWDSGFARVPPLRLPARDAFDIERRWQKGVKLRNEGHRYVVCCERLQGMVRDLTAAGAPMPAPTIWPTPEDATSNEPSALAYLAVFEYLRRFYKLSVIGTDGQQRVVGLKHRRVEAIFHAPGKTLAEFANLLTHITKESRLAEIFKAAADRAEVSCGNPLTPTECRIAFERRESLIARCVREDCGLVDVFDLS